jgi:uncharacterized protein (TIGR02118 family)
MVRLVVLYGHPSDPSAFEAYYQQTHLPLVRRAIGSRRIETARFLSPPDGPRAEYYRLAIVEFDSPEDVGEVFESADGQAVLADMQNFATGGHVALLAESGSSEAAEGAG